MTALAAVSFCTKRASFPTFFLRHSTALYGDSKLCRWNSWAARFVDRCPSSLQPYLRLSRVDKPIGSWLLYWPCTWGIALATEPTSLPSFKMLALFGMGSFLMRGAACIINDLWDRDIDGKVARTKFRPLASGAVSQTGAIGSLGLHLTAALPIVFSLNYYSVALAFSSVVPVILYPMMKRFTHWPQLWLGFTINWGVLVGYSAVKGHLDASVLPLYAACICWTIIYDTIYAHQDKKDDVKIGVKSTALLFGSQTKPWMALFGTSMCLGGTAAGILSQQTWPYFATFYGSLAVLGWQIWKLNLDNENECLKVFKSSWWFGLALFTGICLGNLLKQS